MVFTDMPDYFADNSKRSYAMHSGKLLDWMFYRMSIDPDEVAYDYVLRCYGRKELLPTTKAGRGELIEACAAYRFGNISRCSPKALVGLGTATLEAFTGKSKVGEVEGLELRCWEGVVQQYSPTIWISYSPWAHASEAPNIFRTIYCAAESAGLNPKLDPSVEPYVWPDLRK